MLCLYHDDEETRDIGLLGWFEDRFGETLAYVTLDGRIVEAPEGTPKHGRGFKSFIQENRGEVGVSH